MRWVRTPYEPGDKTIELVDYDERERFYGLERGLRVWVDRDDVDVDGVETIVADMLVRLNAPAAEAEMVAATDAYEQGRQAGIAEARRAVDALGGRKNA